MKISNSKKQLAKIINENGGWRDGAEFSAQDSKKDSYPSRICFYRNKPVLEGLRWFDGNCGMVGDSQACIEGVNQIPNWHQTILSRDEYFHLYPAPDADGWIEWKGGECPVEDDAIIDIRLRDGYEESGVDSDWSWAHSGEGDIIAYRLHKPEQSKSTAVGDDETNLAAKEELEAMEFQPSPTIEQLAADYRAKLAIAQQAREEADSHRCGAEAALEKLVAAGKALGLVLSVEAPKPEKPAKPYTGKLYNDDIGSDVSYGDVSYGDEKLFDQVCDGCGRRLGQHFGQRCTNA